MTRFIAAFMLAAFALALPVSGGTISTEASAKSKKCTDWCTNKSTGRKFRIGGR